MAVVRPLERLRVAGAVVDIAVPAGCGCIPGVAMAGFRGRADGPVRLPVVPYPAITMFIDLHGTLNIDDTGGRVPGSVVVSGLAPRSMGGHGGDVDLLQVRLSPVVAHAVLGASFELGETVASLEDLWGREAVRLHERLQAAGSWADRFAVMQTALARRLEAGRPVDPEVAFVWDQIVSRRGRVRVEPLAAAVGWSRKQLWSRFRHQLGVTPKRAATLVRFDHAARRLAAGHSAAVVAAESGFVDQSHLSRDVMAIAGITPKAVAVAPWLAVDPVAWPAQPWAARS